MTAVWQVQEAKSRLSELMDRAVTEGPQIITRHGKPVVKVVAVGQGDADAPGGDAFTRFLLGAPKVEGFALPPRRGRKPPPEFG